MTLRHQPTSAQDAADAMAKSCLALRLRVLNRVVAGGYDAALRPLDLTAGQLSILAVLVKKGSMTQSRLAEILMIEQSTLSRNLQRMKERDLIDEALDQQACAKLLSASRRGRRTLERAFPIWQRAQKDALKQLGAGGPAALKAMAAPLFDQPGSS